LICWSSTPVQLARRIPSWLKSGPRLILRTPLRCRSNLYRLLLLRRPLTNAIIYLPAVHSTVCIASSTMPSSRPRVLRLYSQRIKSIIFFIVIFLIYYSHLFYLGQTLTLTLFSCSLFGHRHRHSLIRIFGFFITSSTFRVCGAL
jgi:hypothetical protein